MGVSSTFNWVDSATNLVVLHIYLTLNPFAAFPLMKALANCLPLRSLDFNGPLAVLLVVLFFTTFFMTVAFNCTSTLLIDFYPKQPATASAANNLTRCLLGAGATSAVLPMISALGVGWTFTILGLGLWLTSPMLWLVYFKGMEWRKQRNRRERMREEKGKATRDQEQDVQVQGGVLEASAVMEEEKEANGDLDRRKRVAEEQSLQPHPVERTASYQSSC